MRAIVATAARRSAERYRDNSGAKPWMIFGEITLKHGTAREARTREQLQRLLVTFDLSPWIYTKSIVVDGSFGALG